MAERACHGMDAEGRIGNAGVRLAQQLKRGWVSREAAFQGTFRVLRLLPVVGPTGRCAAVPGRGDQRLHLKTRLTRSYRMCMPN